MRSRRPFTAVALVALTAVVAACGDDGTVAADAERFCGEAVANTDAIVNPPLADEAGLTATLDFYRVMGQLAPVSIAEEWNVLVTALETAAALEPGNPQSEQHVAATAYASEPAAYAVKQWLTRNCGLDIPITTIAPHAQVPALTTTTVASSTATTAAP